MTKSLWTSPEVVDPKVMMTRTMQRMAEEVFMVSTFEAEGASVQSEVAAETE